MGKPDSLAAEFTDLFSEVGRRALPRQALSTVGIADVVAVSSVSRHNRAAWGKPTCLCPGIFGAIHGYRSMEFQSMGICQEFCLGNSKPGEPPSKCLMMLTMYQAEITKLTAMKVLLALFCFTDMDVTEMDWVCIACLGAWPRGFALCPTLSLWGQTGLV